MELTHYLKTFSTLRSDTSSTRWTAATKFRAPHKPPLLLAVIDLIAQGIIKTNFIEFTLDLGVIKLFDYRLNIDQFYDIV